MLGIVIYIHALLLDLMPLPVLPPDHGENGEFVMSSVIKGPMVDI